MNQKTSFLYGINAITEVLSLKNNNFNEIFILENKVKDKSIDDIISMAKDQNIRTNFIPKITFENKFNMEGHGGIAASFVPKQVMQEADLKYEISKKVKEDPYYNWTFLILDNIQDPHNLGSCLRTAAACNVDGVILTSSNSASITDLVRKISMGSTEMLDLYIVNNLSRNLEFLKEQNIWLVGTSLDTDKSLYELDLKSSVGLVMGSEGEGIRPLTAKHCDFLAKLPMKGQVQSLNVSVATGVCLFEIMRQKG